jgi:hypothetical protein
MSNGQTPMINVGGNIPPEILQQQQALNRQQQMAQLLMQQGMNQPSGQMVSGRYVAPSFFQYATPLLQSYAGQRLAEKGDKQATDLAKALRQQYANEMENYLKLQRGTPAVSEQYTEMAGPFGEGVGPNNTDISMPVAYRPAQAAVAADPMAANLYGSTAYNPVLQQMASKKLLEGPKWKEITQYNDKTGNTETYRYDENASDPRSTLQFLGINKPAISPEAQIRFADEGIGVPQQFRGGAVGQPSVSPVTNVTTVNQPAATSQAQPAPSAAPTVASSKGYDYFKPPPAPSGLSAKQTREFISEQNKPLTGKANDEVNGAISYQKSLDNLISLFDKYKGADMLKPNVRAEFQGALRTAQLQGKEAFGLGVLNGPDLGILEQVLADPTAFDAFLKDRTTINKLYNNQRMFTSDKIKTNYRSAQKAVPENLREFVEIKPIELTSDKKKTEGQPRPTGRVVRAMMGNEPIIVKDNKWVYEKTGKPVQ